MFPSPSGDHAFSNQQDAIERLEEMIKVGFRPLQGIMHLATNLSLRNLLRSNISFRPLQGIMHLATNGKNY